jgi:chorismate lyase/3-hydroxybenzoate synthase
MSHGLPAAPEGRTLLAVEAAPGAGAEPLGGFGFGASGDATQLPLLAGSAAPECWHSPIAGALRIESLYVAGAEDIQAAARAAYTELLARVRGSAQPCLLRIWNFFDGINQGEGDAERYRAFCVGRAAAVDRAFHASPPAATAIGLPAGCAPGLQVVALCGAEPALTLENPRQTPAWRYPREYGPVAPGFSRGAVIGQGRHAVLLASGTASILGHVSQHPGEVDAQLEESLRNLEALLAEGQARTDSQFSLRRCSALRAYVRRAEHGAGLLSRLQARLGPDTPIRVLHGDICRRELEVELEGVFVAQ